MLGIGHYRVTVELPETGGLYPRGNVTYRGTEVGEVKSVDLTDTGVEAVLSLDSDIKIPSDLTPRCTAQSAVGEQYVALLPRSGDGPALKDGDVIPMDRTSVPPDINTLLDATNRGLEAIPHDNLKTVIDEAYIAFGGLGPELRRLVKGSTALAIDAAQEPRCADHADRPVQAGAGHARPTPRTRSRRGRRTWRRSPVSCRARTRPWRGFSRRVRAPPTRCGRCSTGCSPRCRSCWPTWSASGKSPSPTSRPRAAAGAAARRAPRSRRPSACTSGTPSRTTRATALIFNLNLVIPCCRPDPLRRSTAAAVHDRFLPAQQQRVPTFEDYPDRPPGDVYCRVPAGRAVQRARRHEPALHDRAR